MKSCPACNFSFPDFHHVCDFDGTELIPDPERPSLVNVPASRLRRVFRSPIFLTGLAILMLIFSAILIGCLETGVQSIPTVKDQTLARPITSSAAVTTASEASPAQANSIAAPRRRSIARLKKLPRLSHARLRRQGTPSRSVARLNERASNRDLFESKPRVELSSDAGIPRDGRAAGRNGSAAQADRSGQTVGPLAVVVATGSQKSEVATRKETQQTSRTAALQTTRRDVANEKPAKITAFLKTTWKVLKKPFDF